MASLAKEKKRSTVPRKSSVSRAGHLLKIVSAKTLSFFLFLTLGFMVFTSPTLFSLGDESKGEYSYLVLFLVIP